MLSIFRSEALFGHLVYYYIIWTDNRGTVLEANTRRQEGTNDTIKVLRSCLLKLSLYLVNSVFILYRTGNMQSAILLSFIASSSLPPCGHQSTHPSMPCYISPYVVYNVDGFIAFSSLPPCRLQSTHPLMPCYISPYVVYNVDGLDLQTMCALQELQ